MERHQAIDLVKSHISDHEGWISDHTLFFNKAATLRFEMPGYQFPLFVASLASLGLVLKPQSLLPTLETEDMKAVLAMTFIHNEMDLKQDVPHFG